jgi:hypothetical protein
MTDIDGNHRQIHYEWTIYEIDMKQYQEKMMVAETQTKK